MDSDAPKLVSISKRRRFHRVGEVDPDVAAVWQIIVTLAIRHGANRYVVEGGRAAAPDQGAADDEIELVQRGLEAQSLNLFAGDVWVCGISDEGTDIAVALPDNLLRSIRPTVEASGLVWDEF